MIVIRCAKLVLNIFNFVRILNNSIVKYMLFLFLFFGACNASETVKEENVITDYTVKIEVNSAELENDELFITYYEYQTNTYNWNPYTISYDTNGNSLPVIITLENYSFRYIEGEVYRNNNIPSQISLKISVNDEVVIDESKTGTGNEYVTIKFNYDIKTKKNL